MSPLDRFKDGLNEINILLSLGHATQSVLPSQAAAAPLESRQEEAGVTVRRAAVILLVSHFEGFLKSIGEELVDSLSAGTLETRRIPRGVRQVHVVPKLAEIVSCGNDDQRFKLLSKLTAISALWTDTAKPPRGVLRAEIVTREIHNADSESIDSLFSMFGVKDSVCDGELDIPANEHFPEESHDIRIRLRDMVKCRNDIAHGGMDRQPTAEDVQRYTIFLEHLAKRLQRRTDRLIAEFLAEINTEQPTPRPRSERHAVVVDAADLATN